MDKVQVGKVTTLKRARLHLDVDGRARCGSGRGRILGGTRRAPVPADEPTICRHCLPHLRRAIDEAQAVAVAAPRNRYSEAEVARLTAMSDALLSAAERAELAELAARVAATIEHAAEVQAQPVEQRRRTWADLRREFAETHQPVLAA